MQKETLYLLIIILNDIEFPILDDVEYKKIDVNINKFLDILKKITFASLDNDTRVELSGVYFDFRDDINIVSTDDARMVKKIIKTECRERISLNLPKNTINELSRISLIENVDDFEFYINESSILIKFGNTEIQSKLIEGNYPDYNSIIPKEFLFEIEINKDELLKILKLNSVVLDKNENEIELKFSENNLKVYSQFTKYGEIENDIEIKNDNEKELKVNYEYIIQGLEKFDNENVKIRIFDNIVYIYSEKEQYYYMLVTLI